MPENTYDWILAATLRRQDHDEEGALQQKL